MADIVTFVPQSHLDARANMTGFIELCRTEVTAFGSSLAFDADRWNVSDYIQHKGRYESVNLVFSNEATAGAQRPVMMSEPFRSFAKAYLRYQHGMKPTKSVGQRLSALRTLEVALLEVGPADPVQTSPHVLNRAAQLLAKRLGSETAYRVANQLKMVADFLCDNRLMAVPTRWRHPLKKPEDHRMRVGKAADERRAAKMPGQAALDALPKLFLLAIEPIDVLVSSITAILCSAPDRISEVLCLPVNCEVRQRRERSDEDAYGLRWWPSKGAAPMVKWIIPSMAHVVQQALGKIRRLTDEARKVAQWYEANATHLYLTEDTEHFRAEEWLCMADVSRILFAEAANPMSIGRWCDENAVYREKRGNTTYCRFDDLELAVLRLLPPGFPFADRTTGLKYSDALFVIQRNTLEPYKARYRCVIEPVKYGQVSNRLGERSSGRNKTIFERCGFHEPDGAPIHVTTHQFRHFLNTLAQQGGLSQLDIAKWSGRKEVRQNRSYDHESSTGVVARIRAAVGDDSRFFGPLANGPRAEIITRDEFARLKVPTAHTTDFGYCIHDYVMSPCEMHRDCLNCGEQVCVKGEAEKERRIRQAHTEATHLLRMAEMAEAEGEFGANQWAEHHRGYLVRIQALLDVIDDPTTPLGAFIQLIPAEELSRLEQSTQARVLLAVPVEQPTSAEAGAWLA